MHGRQRILSFPRECRHEARIDSVKRHHDAGVAVVLVLEAVHDAARHEHRMSRCHMMHDAADRLRQRAGKSIDRLANVAVIMRRRDPRRPMMMPNENY